MPNLLDFLINLDSLSWLDAAVLGAITYIFVLWAALVVWVARDAVGRTKSIFFQVVAILLVIGLNIFGLVLYLILRPQKTLLEKYFEELEQEALEDELKRRAQKSAEKKLNSAEEKEKKEKAESEKKEKDSEKKKK